MYMAAQIYEISLQVVNNCSWVKYFQHEKRNFISPSDHVMFYLLYEIPNHFTLQSTQVKRTPQDYINEFIIRTLNPLVYSCRFQIFVYILACVMSHEFTRDSVMKLLPPKFPWIWRKCLLRNLTHLKIFNLTKYREVLVKYSLLSSVCMQECQFEFNTSYQND